MLEKDKIAELTKKLEQREDFIYDIYWTLNASSSKSALRESLLSLCTRQINSQKLGVI
jgi:hypothetical protein